MSRGRLREATLSTWESAIRAIPIGFLAGIECDGASYHSGKLARDRDACVRKCWKVWENILGIWSTDYFRDRERTMERVYHALRGLLEHGRLLT